jgi:predicted aldo/keto reductase-like oxidoreductase
VATASREEPLSAEGRQRIVEALEETRRLLNLYCTGCGYCMPCPNEVDIPANFNAMNYYRVWELKEHARSLYRSLAKKRRRRGGVYTTVDRCAEACVECGECEPKCPQNIPIKERLKETAAVLGEN